MIGAKEVVSLLEQAERLKYAQFDLKKFNDLATNQPMELKRLEGQMTTEIQDLIESFDLTGDRLISPEEFFNIIMFAYN